MKTLLTNAKVIDPVTETISDGEVMFEDGVIIPKELILALQEAHFYAPFRSAEQGFMNAGVIVRIRCDRNQIPGKMQHSDNFWHNIWIPQNF